MKRTVFLVTVLISFLAAGCGPSANNGTNTPGSNANSNANSASPAPTPAIVTCTPIQNRAIIAYIGNGVANDPDLSGISSQINWDAIDCKAYLTGWTDTIQKFKKLEKYALNAPSVVTMENEKLWLAKGDTTTPNGGACADGWLPCGDICIPPGQTCNNGSKAPGPASATPTPKP